MHAIAFPRQGGKQPRRNERTRTAYPCSLRVCGHVLQGIAQGCKSRISRRFPLLRVAECCTVLRSRWYQSGIRRVRWIRSARYFSNTKTSFDLLTSDRLLLRSCAAWYFAARSSASCLEREYAVQGPTNRRRGQRYPSARSDWPAAVQK
jgi:hypothetical protein